MKNTQSHPTVDQPLADQHVQGTGSSSDIAGDKFGVIKERLHMHPNADLHDIVASLELDGIHVTSEEVQEVLHHMERPAT